MLYHFLFPLADQHILFNVFQYISFRAAGAMVTALLTAFIIGPGVIRRLRKHGIGQIVRAEGPATHLVKAGTPTMGGIIILTACLLPTLLWARLDNTYVWVALVVTAWMGAIGFMDDYLKIVRRHSRGLIARYKLTDGLDGLATGLAAIAALTFGAFAYAIGRVDTSAYLGVLYLDGAGELSVFCAALAGAAIGFLWFNAHPAEVIMGDTGSLALGGAIGSVAVLLKSEFLLVIVGGVFVLEGLSVILQTGWFKFSRRRWGEGRRLLRMAPLHHHFEKLGWPETRVVTRFYIVGVICALVGLATLKIR